MKGVAYGDKPYNSRETAVCVSVRYRSMNGRCSTPKLLPCQPSFAPYSLRLFEPMAQFRAHATVALQAAPSEANPGRANAEETPPPSVRPPANVDELVGPLKRVEFRVSENFLEGLDLLATAEGRTRADILRRALGLYARAAGEKANNRYLAFAEINEDNTLNVTELIAL